MITRRDVLSQAVDACMKELYSCAYPHIEWDDFKEECKIYSIKYKEWEKYKKLEHENLKLYNEYNDKLGWEGKSVTECIGPRPFEFYYLPKEIMENICDSYIFAYQIDSQQELLNTISILKDYCENPIVDKYISEHTDENGNYHPGYRGYDHPDNLLSQLVDLIPDSGFDKSVVAESVQDKFFEFLDMAGNFFNWNRDLNSFNISVYMGPSPNSNREAVIENWRKYRNQDIEINEEQIKKDYYGELD